MLSIALVIGLSMTLIAIFLAIVERFPSTISIESVIAGDLNKSREDDMPIQIKRSLKITDRKGREIDLRLKRYELLKPSGDSMVARGIKKGSLVVLDKKMGMRDLRQGDLIALIVLEDHFDDSKNKKKLRLFHEIKTDVDGQERLFVCEYPLGSNQPVPCEFTHPTESYIGMVVASFEPDELDEIVGSFGATKAAA